VTLEMKRRDGSSCEAVRPQRRFNPILECGGLTPLLSPEQLAILK